MFKLQLFIFFRLARVRTKSKCGRLDTGLVRRETFKGNVNNFLAVNLTLADLDLSKSTEDLSQFSKSSENLTQTSLIPSPLPSPQPSPRRRNRSRSNNNNNNNDNKDSNPFSNNPTFEHPPPEDSADGNLIQF